MNKPAHSQTLAILLSLGLCVASLSAEAARTTQYTYNNLGQVLTIDGPRTDVSDVTTFVYDSAGNRIRTTNALGHVTEITDHDGNGRPLRIVDANGVVTNLSYDPRGRLVSRDVAGSVTTFTYDGVGQITRVTLPDGSYLDYAYDAAQRLVGVSDREGNSISYTLDAMGNRVQEDVRDSSNSLRRTASSMYDSLSRLIESIGASNQTTAYAYDGNGNTISVTDPLNNQTSSAFDALDRLISNTDADNGVTQYAYDARDNLISVTDPEGLTTTYTYDGLDNLIQQVSPDTGTSSYQYDDAGNRTQQTDARGVTTHYSYDALNRLTLIDYPAANLDVTFLYDQGQNGKGRLTQMQDQSGVTNYSYDARGNITQQTAVIQGTTYTTGYNYDAADNLTRTTYPSGRRVDYSRDNQGRITSVTTTKGGNTQTVANNIDYLPFGPVSGLTYGNGLSLADSYDQDYRLARTQCNVLDLQFTYDAASNITDIDNNLDGSRNQDFSYDALYRLTSAAGNYGNLGYSYDRVGNRISKSSTTQSDSYSYANTSHRLNGISGSNSESFSYDNAGNTTQSNAGSFTYNAANRLSQTSTGQGTATYTYNGRGERTLKANGLTTRVYHYDQSGNLIAETDQNGNTINEYIYLDGQRIALITSRVPANDPLGLGGTITSNTPELFFIHADHLNTPQVITDTNRQVVWQADYMPFGTADVTTQLIANNLRFPGQYYDAETDNHYNYFRDYNPTIGRYVESDPIGLDGGLNTYGYAVNNPMNYFDPDGKTPRRSINDEADDPSSCSYYDRVCSASGGKCNYPCNTAPLICKQPDILPTLIGVGTSGINCIRNCLQREDAAARGSSENFIGGCNPCLKDSVIDDYHRDCYVKCGVSPMRYPRTGVWPFGNEGFGF